MSPMIFALLDAIREGNRQKQHGPRQL